MEKPTERSQMLICFIIPVIIVLLTAFLTVYAAKNESEGATLAAIVCGTVGIVLSVIALIVGLFV